MSVSWQKCQMTITQCDESISQNSRYIDVVEWLDTWSWLTMIEELHKILLHYLSIQLASFVCVCVYIHLNKMSNWQNDLLCFPSRKWPLIAWCEAIVFIEKKITQHNLCQCLKYVHELLAQCDLCWHLLRRVFLKSFHILVADRWFKFEH